MLNCPLVSKDVQVRWIGHAKWSLRVRAPAAGIQGFKRSSLGGIAVGTGSMG